MDETLPHRTPNDPTVVQLGVFINSAPVVGLSSKTASLLMHAEVGEPTTQEETAALLLKKIVDEAQPR